MNCSVGSTKKVRTSPPRRFGERQLAAILDLIADGTISGKIAKDVFEIVWIEGGDPRAIVEQRGLQQVTDVSAIKEIVDDIVADNPDKVADAKTNPKAIGWFVGQVMKASGGKANPQTVNDLLKKKLRHLSAKVPCRCGARTHFIVQSPCQTRPRAQIVRASLPRSVARGRRACRWCESVGTDSRVLRLAGAVNALAGPSGA